MSTSEKTPERDALFRRSYLYAALQDRFAPLEAVRWAAGGRLPDDLHLISQVMALLRPHCLPDPKEDAAQMSWVMRPAARHYALDAARVERDTVARFNTDLADARLGRGRFAPDALDARIASGDAAPDLARIAAALDRAGPHAPGADRVAALRALMNRAEDARQAETIRARNLQGREAELAQIAQAIAAPQTKPPLRAVVISGGPGIGKSSLLDLAIEDARAKPRPVVVRLDFARSGLDPRDAQSFYNEISRQLGDALPDLTTPARPGIIPAIAQAVQSADRPLLIVLDTVEALRDEAESRVSLLFERLDRLSHAGVPRIVILAAGQRDFMAPAPDRVRGTPIRLSGLEDQAARVYLAAQSVPDGLWPGILALAQGNPLFLRLAAQAARKGALQMGDLPADAAPERVATTLYLALMSDMPAPHRPLAKASLLLRDISRDSLAEVIAPIMAPETTRDSLDAAFRGIAAQDHLVTHDAASGLLRHHDDVRRAFLPLVYADAPDLCARINARAVTFYERLARADLALYHRLQQMRAGLPAPVIGHDIAHRLPPDAVQDLIPAARDALRQAQGRRSDVGRAGHVEAPHSTSIETPALTGAGPLIHFDTRRDRLRISPGHNGHAPDPRALRDLAHALAGHDLREAEYIVQHGLSGDMPAQSVAARLLLCHLWLSGRWSSALRLFALQPQNALDAALAKAPGLEGRILLDVTAEFRFGRLVARLRADRALARAALGARGWRARGPFGRGAGHGPVDRATATGSAAKHAGPGAWHSGHPWRRRLDRPVAPARGRAFADCGLWP